MGKATGFLDYERQDKKAEAAKERISHFREFHKPLTEEEQKKQGARCMDCGVPFCQAGMMIAGMANFLIRPPTGAVPRGFSACIFSLSFSK